MADDTNTAESEATYLCQAWGETDLPSAAIVRGLNAVRAFLVEQWLGDEDQEHDDGTKALPAAMADMQEQWELEGEAWKWSISFEIGGISVQRVDDVGRTSLAASAGSEPVAWIDDGTTGVGTNSEHRVVTDATKQSMHKSLAASFSTPLYLRPSPPEGMAGWTKASEQLPPCRDNQLYIGVNSAGFAGVFNAVTSIAGNVYCHYETAEESIDVLGDLAIWKKFNPPLPASEAKEL